LSASAAPSSAVELLVFELGGVRHGLELATVREVVRAVLVTPLPDAPAVVEGVISARGEVVPVYDLRLRFGMSVRPLHPDERMVLAWTGDRLVAFRCDHADETVSVSHEAVADATMVRHAGRTISGIGRLRDGILLIHDLTAFLDDAERLTLAEALAALEERAAE
jgi:purine-binding chemotaxis protein CheW